MDIFDLEKAVDWNRALHNTRTGSSLLAVELKDLYAYDKEQKKFTNNVVGYALTVVDQSNAFKRSIIRIKTNKHPSLALTESIDNQTYCNVFFEGLVGKIYKDFSTNEIKISLTADSVEVLDI